MYMFYGHSYYFSVVIFGNFYSNMKALYWGVFSMKQFCDISFYML
jgi:hypothetical protein